MKIVHIVTILAISLMCPILSSADENASGVERVGEGTVETITAPRKIVEGITEETEDKGAVGVVTGSVIGGAKAAEQAVEGAADIATGVIETILDPLTGGDN